MTDVLAATSARRLPGFPGGQPPRLYAGLAVASIGGPLALVALYLPGLFADAGHGAVAAGILGIAAFAAPTLIWCRYSERVAGPGGLYAFTAAAAGRRLATVQAGLWLTSYLLYLLYTTDYVVYDVLPATMPAVTPWRPVLEITLPLLLIALVIAPLRVSLSAVAGSAVVQVVVTVMLLAAAAARGAHPVPVAPAHPGTSATVAGNVALLFICASLPVFFGGDVAGGGRTVRRTLPRAVAGVGVLVVLAAAPGVALARFSSYDVPGVTLARATVGEGFAVVVGLGVALSVLTLVVVEYLALARLGHALTGRPAHVVVRWLAVPLVAASVVSLVDPGRFYVDLLRPSLVALWLAQLVPVLAYPRFAARTVGLRRGDVTAVVVAGALMVFGLWTAVRASGGT